MRASSILRRLPWLVVIVVTVTAARGRSAIAGELSKHACVEAHSRGQDARDQGKLSLARTLFLTCAQASCPGAVQADCARLVESVAAMQPTVVFVARDSDGNDLPATAVHVDGVLVTTRLDGRSRDIDPGTHAVRFTHDGRDEIVTVVIGTGEQDRIVLARFRSSSRPGSLERPLALEHAPAPRRYTARTTRTTHPGGSVALAITGSFVMVGGAALAVYARSTVPAACSLATAQCAAPPGDPVFAQATRGARLVNLGLVGAGVGAATTIGGLIWYIAGARTSGERATQVSPLVTRDGGGVALSGRF